MKRAARSGGRYALTEYWVREQHEKSALLDVQIHTGRTHQIRVHLAYIGHPVIGDYLYGVEKKPALNRYFLHAHSLKFKHPNGEDLTLTSDFPDELRDFWYNTTKK